MGNFPPFVIVNNAENGSRGSRGARDAIETDEAQLNRIFATENISATVVTTFQPFWTSTTNLWRLDSGNSGLEAGGGGSAGSVRGVSVTDSRDFCLLLLLAALFLERPI
jgi:hypothetical protein